MFIITSIQFGYMEASIMKYLIRELRDITGMTQKEFSQMYGIPLSTLRKWEQGESSPAPYVINLLAKTLPSLDNSLLTIHGTDDVLYYYDINKSTVADMLGNVIIVQEDLREIKTQNLALYLDDLFKDFYEIQEKFNRDCRFDKKEDIIWSNWEG